MQRVKKTLRERCPRDLTLQGFVEAALEDLIDRVEREGWTRPIPEGTRTGRPLK